MLPKIGFAIVSYNAPQQLLRLTQTLNKTFGAPPIACHHDFAQCPLDEGSFPKNVRFVRPHIDTAWGNITVAMAALRAFALLRKYDSPDWFFQLSGSDYPVRPANEISADLSKADHDAYLDHREILYGRFPPGQTARDGGFGRPDWIPLAYERYCTLRIAVPWPSRTQLFASQFPFRKRYFSLGPSISNWTRKIIFKPRWRIYGGDFWFHANQRAIDRLLDDKIIGPLLRYYRNRFIPEESIFHTALANLKDLHICKSNMRYEDWREGRAHPKWLEHSDLPQIRECNAHFARKFRDTAVLDAIDRNLLQI
jgi:hypothetical protein